MPLPIVDLSVNSISQIGTETFIDFKFTKPAGIVGGYYLFISSSGVVYTKIDTRIDSSHRKDPDLSTYVDNLGKTHFETILSGTLYNGRVLYFYIQVVNADRTVSVPSNVLTVNTFPSKPNNLAVLYDGYENDLSWDPLDFSEGRNASFLNFEIYKSPIIEVSGSKLSTNLLINAAFTVGKTVWVIDVFKKSQWFGEITTEGQLDLTNIKLDNYSDIYATIAIDNLKVYLEDTLETLVGTTTSTGYIDTTYITGSHFIYKVRSVTTAGRKSNYDKFPIYTVLVIDTAPVLRSVENSSTGFINNIYWMALKNVLIDKKYYNKSSWAIPYSKTETYNFKGFLGVSRCKLDVFINGLYGFTTSTGQYGEFKIDYQFPLGDIYLQFQARDKINTNFSQKSTTYLISTLNLYTFFSSISEQYKKLIDEIDLVKLDCDITKARYTSFSERYSPLIELYKNGAEDDVKFVSMASEIYKAFEFVSYDEALNVLFTALESVVTEFDHHEIYYNDGLFLTKKTGFSFVAKAYTSTGTSTGIARDKYYYAVSSVTSTGEETSYSTIQVDTRLWPVGLLGLVVLKWNPSNHIVAYNIYRGTSTGLLGYMRTISGNIFVDRGFYSPNYLINPMEYNFTDYDAPTNISVYIKNNITQISEFFKIPLWMWIVIYAKDSSDIPDYQLERIKTYAYKFIPPETRYRIIYCNDIKSEFLV